MTNDPWSTIPVGTLTDADIIGLARQGLLIDGGFSEACVKQACYELRASEIFYEPASSRENKRLEMKGVPYILRPGTFVTVIVTEHLHLPADVLGRILTKGQLVSIGIVPVNTYADPGFQGRLGITLYNSSHRYIAIAADQPIAKIEFSRLPKSVEKPYAGQHGYETQMWPVPVHLYATEEMLGQSGIVRNSFEEIEASYGSIVASLESRLQRYEYKIWTQLALTVLGFAGVFALYGHISLVSAVMTGVAANLITSVGINYFKRRQK